MVFFCKLIDRNGKGGSPRLLGDHDATPVLSILGPEAAHNGEC